MLTIFLQNSNGWFHFFRYCMDIFQNKTPKTQHQNKPEGLKHVETTTETTIFKPKQPTQETSMNRITKMSVLLKYFNQNFVFEDKLRFNFLLHLFSTKLQDLYDNLEQISDREFDDRMHLLSDSLNEIQPYSVQ